MRVVYTLPYLEVKRIEELLDWRLFGESVGAHDLVVPLALWPASVLIEADSLGVVVVNLALAHSDDRTGARLVTRIVVQANLAQGREAHLVFKRSSSLTPFQKTQ